MSGIKANPVKLSRCEKLLTWIKVSAADVERRNNCFQLSGILRESFKARENIETASKQRNASKKTGNTSKG